MDVLTNLLQVHFTIYTCIKVSCCIPEMSGISQQTWNKRAYILSWILLPTCWTNLVQLNAMHSNIMSSLEGYVKKKKGTNMADLTSATWEKNQIQYQRLKYLKSWPSLKVKWRKNYHCFLFDKLCLTLWDPMDCSMSGFFVLHRLPEFAQIHVPWISDAI